MKKQFFCHNMLFWDAFHVRRLLVQYVHTWSQNNGQRSCYCEGNAQMRVRIIDMVKTGGRTNHQLMIKREEVSGCQHGADASVRAWRPLIPDCRVRV